MTRDESGKIYDWPRIMQGLFHLRWAQGDERPPRAHVAAQYRGYWFYIDETGSGHEIHIFAPDGTITPGARRKSGPRTRPDPTPRRTITPGHAIMDAMPVVRHFRQILIGAMQLAPLPASSGIQHPWDFLAQADSAPGRKSRTSSPPIRMSSASGITSNSSAFCRSYSAFYGEADPQHCRAVGGKSPIRTFRHRRLARVRITLRPDASPVEFQVAHADLVFFP